MTWITYAELAKLSLAERRNALVRGFARVSIWRFEAWRQLEINDPIERVLPSLSELGYVAGLIILIEECKR